MIVAFSLLVFCLGI